jgi:hypothetical protein
MCSGFHQRPSEISIKNEMNFMALNQIAGIRHRRAIAKPAPVEIHQPVPCHQN